MTGPGCILHAAATGLFRAGEEHLGPEACQSASAADLPQPGPPAESRRCLHQTCHLLGSRCQRPPSCHPAAGMGLDPPQDFPAPRLALRAAGPLARPCLLHLPAQAVSRHVVHDSVTCRSPRCNCVCADSSCCVSGCSDTSLPRGSQVDCSCARDLRPLAATHSEPPGPQHLLLLAQVTDNALHLHPRHCRASLYATGKPLCCGLDTVTVQLSALQVGNRATGVAGCSPARKQ